jgi:hypothetical protein
MILAEIGTEMTRFPTRRTWPPGPASPRESTSPPVDPRARPAPGTANRYLARIVGEAAVSAARTDTFLGERYRRIARRRGRKRAIVAIGRSILVIVWALLSDEQAQFVDLGPDYYASRANPERKVRQHVRGLQALGYSVTPQPRGITKGPGMFGLAAFSDSGR